MSAIPVTIQYGTAPTIDEQHRIGKYCYGHAGEGFNFSNDSNSTGLIWRTGYSSDNFGGGTAQYYIVSRANVEGIGSEPTIPTYHVTGRTNPEILHLINRLHSIKEDNVFYTDVNLAKRYVIDNQNLNHFLADLANYKYWNSTKLQLNFDFGNLNCDILEDDLTKCYDLCQAVDGTIERWFIKNTAANIFTSFSDPSNYATANRRFNSPTAYLDLNSTNTASYITPLNTTAQESFMFAIRCKITPAGEPINIMYTNGGVTRLRYDNTSGEIVFGLGGDLVGITLQPNVWITIIFGRNNQGDIFISDGDNNNTNNQTGNTEMIFDNGFTIGSFGANSSDVRIGSFQFWKGANYNYNDWSPVHNYQMLEKWF
jgi:hypothetical protein